MAMLATLEGTETPGTDEYILSRMFEPNDGLGVELLGVDGWNFAKRKVATAARNALKNRRLFIVPEIIYCDQMDKPVDMGMVQLFGMDVDYCTELLGLNPFKSITDTAKKAIETVHDTAVKSTKKVIKGGLKEAKKQVKDPFYAFKVSTSPTLQARAIAKTDPTGLSTKVFEKTYKFAPDVLPNLIFDKATKESVKLDPTGVSQKIYKISEKSKDVISKTTPAGAYDAYAAAQRKRQAAKAAEQAQKTRQGVADNLYTTSEATQEPTIIYQQMPGTTQYVPAPTEPQTMAPAGFDWSGLVNWKTLAIGGMLAYFVFGRGKRGKRK